MDLVFNGIDGSSGLRLAEPTTTDEFGELILDGWWGGSGIAELAFKRDEPHLGLGHAIASERLDKTGWAVVGSETTSPDTLAALRPLLDLRRDQAGDRYRDLIGADGFLDGDDKRRFLQRHHVGLGMPVDPARVPYYLLLLGGPEAIPFEFQYEMAAEYAVGRIEFDEPDEYRRYAERVVAAEARSGPSQPAIDLFGPSNPDDPATQQSAVHLVGALHDQLVAHLGESTVSTVPPEEATKDALLALLSKGSDLLFTAGHGIGFPSTDAQQRARQGALLCQDWPGPKQWSGALDPRFFVSASDAERLGSIAPKVVMSFACFGAGTPRLDEYPRRHDAPARVIADRPFVASLPKTLLAHRGGGALGFVGHVDRTWGSSFLMPDGQMQVDVFDNVARAIVDGIRLGNATRWFGSRYLAVGGALNTVLDEVRRSGRPPDRARIAQLWLESNDARGVVVLGDPAVRVRRPEDIDGDSDTTQIRVSDEEVSGGVVA